MKLFVTKPTEDSPRVFESDFFDSMSRTHPVLVAIVFVPLIVGCLAISARAGVGLLANVGLFVTGLTAWTLTEYWLHREFFHWKPPGRLGERMHFLVHGVHHAWPKDKYRLVMPPLVSIGLFFLFLGLFRLVFGSAYCWGWHAGFVSGYLFYDLCHYYIHHAHPRFKWLQQLKKNHMLHHFDDPSTGFGVSTRFWDRVFGTQTRRSAPAAE